MTGGWKRNSRCESIFPIRQQASMRQNNIGNTSILPLHVPPWRGLLKSREPQNTFTKAFSRWQKGFADAYMYINHLVDGTVTLPLWLGGLSTL